MARQPTNTYELPYTIDDRIAQAAACGFTGPRGYSQFMELLYTAPSKLTLQRPIPWPKKSKHKAETCILPSQFASGQMRSPEQKEKPNHCPKYRREHVCDSCGDIVPSAQLRFLHYRPGRAADYCICDRCHRRITKGWLLDRDNPNYVQGLHRMCMQCRQTFPASLMQVIYARRSKAAGEEWYTPKKCGTLCPACHAALRKALNR